MKALTEAWRKNHPEWHQQQEAKRRALKRNVQIGNTQAIVNWMHGWRKKRRVPCYWCGNKVSGRVAHADHIIPLSRGGPHALSNLVVACSSCNNRKLAKLPSEWNLVLQQPRLIL